MIISLRCRMEEHLTCEYNLSEEQVETMIEIGCKDIKKNLMKIAVSVAGNGSLTDYKVLRMAAHSLKGVLLNLGLKEEADTAKRVEDAAKNGEEIGSVEKLLAIEKKL